MNYDFEFEGICPKTGKFKVKEILYPESRGPDYHYFDTMEEVEAFLQSKGSTLTVE